MRWAGDISARCKTNGRRAPFRRNIEAPSSNLASERALQCEDVVTTDRKLKLVPATTVGVKETMQEADVRPLDGFAAEAARGFAGRSRDGYFADDGVLRRVWCEPMVMIAGMPRALLAMSAHPLFAAAVAQHSAYRRLPWTRLAGTISSFYTIVYGSREAADLAAAHVNALHARVKGRIPAAAGPFPAGTSYAGLDPRLLLWVWSAMVDTGLVMYETYVRRLDEEDRVEFYEGMKLVAQLFGCAATTLPPTFPAFADRLRLWVETDEIVITDEARMIAAIVLHPPLPLLLRPLNVVLNAITFGALPERLRAGYTPTWRPPRRLLAVLARCGPGLGFLLRRGLLDTRRLAASR